MKRARFSAAALVVLAVSAGCATKPEDIEASYVSPTKYQQFSCAQLYEEVPRLKAALGQSYQKQQQARQNDAAGVFFVGLPLASMSGRDATAEVARLKGEIVAIREQGYKKNCWKTKKAETETAKAPPQDGGADQDEPASESKTAPEAEAGEPEEAAAAEID